MLAAATLDVPEFKYSLGRCLLANIKSNQQQMNISIDCLNDRITQTYVRRFDAYEVFMLHKFSNYSNGARSFELFVCMSKPYRQGWIVVNQEPKFVDGPTISSTRLTFDEECACNFRFDFKIFYTNSTVGKRGRKQAEAYMWKTKPYVVATGVAIFALIILVLCVVCSYF
ncbi:uncharacterized protein LOC118504460 [Anopheles stephensi]|uniref:uncharacterized protein LOC118504460 n=1 Tax=Anopheles stephensi TaxID=30069 RepID=UPI001658B8EE|nr:uncharacterized protein LOC118504460 [Anopheles stephensi]